MGIWLLVGSALFLVALLIVLALCRASADADRTMESVLYGGADASGGAPLIPGDAASRGSRSHATGTERATRVRRAVGSRKGRR